MHTSDRLYVDDTSKVLGAKLSKSTRDFAFSIMNTTLQTRVVDVHVALNEKACA